MSTYETIRGRWPFSADFTLMWVGQLVSIVGSGVAGFGLSVWVYQQTGSATQFALVMAFATLPMVLLWPVAGVLADRWGRREAMILSDAGAGAVSAVVLVLLYMGDLRPWHVYVAAGIHSSFGAFQWPAVTAAVPDLVGKEFLGRANGLVELGVAAGRVLGPLLGGVLLATLGLDAIMMLDVATFLVALGTLSLIRIPSRVLAPDVGVGGVREAFRGWFYIRSHAGLVALLVFFVLTNFTSAIPQILLTPLVLSFASEVELGTVLSMLGIGMVVGGLVVTIRGVPQRLVLGLIVGVTMQGLAFIGYSMTTSVLLIAVAGFAYGVCLTFIRGTNQTLWQRTVPAEVLGRAAAFRSAITGLPYPVAFIVAGLLADHFFEPLLLRGGSFAKLAGYVVGTGPGRGTALLILISGVLTIVCCLGMYIVPSLRALESDLPDA